MSIQPKAEAIDYDGLMQANLKRVFSEANPTKRLKAIRELYAEDAVFNEPHDSAKGHAAINDAVTALLASLPPGFVFNSIGPAIGHHNIGRLKWRSGRPNGPPVVTGMDIAHFEGNRIHSLLFFLNLPRRPEATHHKGNFRARQIRHFSTHPHRLLSVADRAACRQQPVGAASA